MFSPKRSRWPPIFFYLFGISRSLPFSVASLKKICAWERLGANVLNNINLHSRSRTLRFLDRAWSSFRCPSYGKEKSSGVENVVARDGHEVRSVLCNPVVRPCLVLWTEITYISVLSECDCDRDMKTQMTPVVYGKKWFQNTDIRYLIHRTT